MRRLHQRLGILPGQGLHHVFAILAVGLQIFAGHAARHPLVTKQGQPAYSRSLNLCLPGGYCLLLRAGRR
ncbi:hypothetical protein D3C76_905730 [compost metagenome]